MLKISTSSVLCNLLAQAAMLFLAAGIPLVHHVCHKHLDHERLHFDPCDESVPALPDEEQDHECHICEFLAAKQLLSVGSTPAITATVPFGNILPTMYHLPVKISPALLEPRAPPNALQLQYLIRINRN